MSMWRKGKLSPGKACPLDAADPHAAVETKRVAPKVIATAEEGPPSNAGSTPAMLTNFAPFRQKLFDHMAQEHGLILLESEMVEIEIICREGWKQK